MVLKRCFHEDGDSCRFDIGFEQEFIPRYWNELHIRARNGHSDNDNGKKLIIFLNFEDGIDIFRIHFLNWRQDMSVSHSSLKVGEKLIRTKFFHCYNNHSNSEILLPVIVVSDIAHVSKIHF